MCVQKIAYSGSFLTVYFDCLNNPFNRKNDNDKSWPSTCQLQIRDYFSAI